MTHFLEIKKLISHIKTEKFRKCISKIIMTVFSEKNVEKMTHFLDVKTQKAHHLENQS